MVRARTRVFVFVPNEYERFLIRNYCRVILSVVEDCLHSDIPTPRMLRIGPQNGGVEVGSFAEKLG